MSAAGHRLAALLAVVVTAAGSSVVPQANAAHPRSEAMLGMPPEFSGTVRIDWNLTAVTKDSSTDYLITRHSDGHAVLEPALGNTIRDYLFFQVRELSGVSTWTEVGPDGPVEGVTGCDQIVNLSPAPPNDYAAHMLWYTPDDALKWGAWGFAGAVVVEAHHAFSDPDCGPPRGPSAIRPLEMVATPAFDYPPYLEAHNTDSGGGRMHIVGSEHYDLSTPWVAKWNSTQDPEYPIDYYTAYDVTVSFDLRRIAAGSKFAQYPTMKLTNDARGRDVIRLRTRQPVPRANFQVTIRKVGSPLIKIVDSWRADAQGRKQLVLPDPKPSKATCYQIVIGQNKVTVPGQTLVKCVK